MGVPDRAREQDYCVRLAMVREGEVYFLLAQAGCITPEGFEPCLSVEVSSDEVMGGQLARMDFAGLDSATRGWYAVEVRVFNCPLAWSVADKLRQRGFVGSEEAEFGLSDLLKALVLLWSKRHSGACDYL
jgi:hypothetical protein